MEWEFATNGKMSRVRADYQEMLISPQKSSFNRVLANFGRFQIKNTSSSQISN